MKLVILHVFSDPKFFNSVSDFFDSVKGVENLYYFFNEEGKCYIDSPKIKVVSNKKEYIGYLSSKDVNAIYFHGLPSARYWMFKFINPEKMVFWWSFGFDIYSSCNALPPLVKRELFKPQTLAYIKKKENFRSYLRQIHFFLRQPYDWYRRRRAISRIDYLTPVLPIEYDFLTRECRYFRAKPFMKNCGPGLPCNAEFVFKKNLGNILVGNSRTYSNNHLDVFSLLNEIKLGGQRKYIVPANYGVDFSSCKELMDACGFNSNDVLWLKEFIPPSEFFKMFDSVSHAIYGHIRQQAMGNIFYCLRSGIKVFLYRDSIIYKQLKSLGYCVYTIDDDLNETSLNSLLPENEALNNYNCFMKRNDFLNEEYILREFESVINEFEIKKNKTLNNIIFTVIDLDNVGLSFTRCDR